MELWETKPIAMTKEQYLAAAEARYDELKALGKLDSFYDYEVEFVKIWQDLGRQVLQDSIGALSKDKRKKKPYDTRLCNDKQ